MFYKAFMGLLTKVVLMSQLLRRWTCIFTWPTWLITVAMETRFSNFAMQLLQFVLSSCSVMKSLMNVHIQLLAESQSLLIASIHLFLSSEHPSIDLCRLLRSTGLILHCHVMLFYWWLSRFLWDEAAGLFAYNPLNSSYVQYKFVRPAVNNIMALHSFVTFHLTRTVLIVYSRLALRMLKLVNGGHNSERHKTSDAPDIVHIKVFNVRLYYCARSWYRLDVCPSVCPSVRHTLVLCRNGLTYIVKLSSLPGSPMIQVFLGPNFFPEFQWEHPNGGVKLLNARM